jgi:hypothetical protein
MAMDFHRKVKEYHTFYMGGINNVVEARWNACQVRLKTPIYPSN